MKKSSFSGCALLLLSLSLSSSVSPLLGQEKNLEPKPQKLEVSTKPSELKGAKIPDEKNLQGFKDDGINQQMVKPSHNQEGRKEEAESPPIETKKNFWDHPYFLAACASSLISLIAIVLSGLALLGVERRRSAALKLKKDLNQNTKLVDNLKSEIGIIDNRLSQQSMENKDRFNQIEAIAKATKPIPVSVNIPEPKPQSESEYDYIAPVSLNTPVPKRESESSFTSIAPATPPQPLGPNKKSLIAALNEGDRGILREVMTAELNITSDSENAIVTGRTVNTELEVVNGGGSYLLVMVQAQPWLFPTEKTLRGFTAVQSSKGLFESEKKTIASPQLLEPALLEGSGIRWTIKQNGRIAIP